MVRHHYIAAIVMTLVGGACGEGGADNDDNGSDARATGTDGQGGPDGTYLGTTHPMVAALPSNTFYEVPDSAFENVCACSHGYQEVCANTYCGGPFAYSGGVLDTLRSKLIVWGGGHSDSAGNEVYTFDMSTLQWTLALPPSTPAASGTTPEALADGRPNSRHSYDGLVYIPSHDRMISFGGSLYSAGDGSNHLWSLEMETLQWRHLSAEGAYQQININNGEPAVNFPFNTGSDYDPVSGKAYFETLTGLYAYTPDSAGAGSFLKILGDSGGHYNGRQGVTDPARRLFISMGGGIIRYYDLDTGTRSDVTSTGPQALVAAGLEMGLAYRQGTIFGWAGSNVFTFDPNTRAFSDTGATFVSSVDSTNGRFAYVPRDDVFVLVTDDPSENVRIYKP